LLEFLNQLPNKFPLTKTVLYTESTNARFLKKCLDYNVKGMIYKKGDKIHHAAETILKTIEIVNHGFICINKIFSSRISIISWAKGNDNFNFDGSIKNYQLIKLLTPREKETISYIKMGKSNKEIAEALYISVGTLEQHKNNIKKKLNLKSANEILGFLLKNKKYFGL